MMAFLRLYKSSSSSSLSNNYISIFRILLYSTETTKKQIISRKNNNEILYKRISPNGDPNISMIPILDEWEKQVKKVRFNHLIAIIKSLRKFNRFSHALQISEWMSDRKSKVQPAGAAIHLDLISRVNGVEQAEKYFDSIPDDVKNLQVYGALLNCYTTTKSVEKAEATAQKMKQMGMMTTLAYNSMLYLYKKIGDIEKMEQIYREMIDLGGRCDKTTFYIRLSAYAFCSDLEGIEKVLKDMEEMWGLNVDWNAYVIASSGYLKSGLHDKAYEMLKKSEELIHEKSGVVWETLLGMYASLGKNEDVYRIWNTYKTSCKKIYNRGYSAIIKALVKLDDIDGAETLLTEWESKNLTYDFRIPDILINAYCTRGLLVKAETYVDRIIATGKQLPASTWVLLATGYRRKNKMERAVEMMKKSVIAVDKRRCKVDQDTLKVCVEYLKNKGDVKCADEIETAFKDMICVSETNDEECLGDKNSESLGFGETEDSHR